MKMVFAVTSGPNLLLPKTQIYLATNHIVVTHANLAKWIQKATLNSKVTALTAIYLFRVVFKSAKDMALRNTLRFRVSKTQSQQYTRNCSSWVFSRTSASGYEGSKPSSQPPQCLIAKPISAPILVSSTSTSPGCTLKPNIPRKSHLDVFMSVFLLINNSLQENGEQFIPDWPSRPQNNQQCESIS